MARNARQVSKTGIYHLMARGINGQNIFHDEDEFTCSFWRVRRAYPWL